MHSFMTTALTGLLASSALANPFPQKVVENLQKRNFTGTVTVPTVLPTAVVTATPSAIPEPSPGKRGLAYNDDNLTGLFSGPVTWAYNWASLPADGYNNALEYVPILWGDDSDHTTGWSQNVNTCAAQYGTKNLLGFNEPDLCNGGSACIDPQTAANDWNTYIQPFAGNFTLGSPAVSSSANANEGLDWLNQFMGDCSGCTIDFIVLHWYGDITDPASFTNYIAGAYQQFQKPIWVTEFGNATETTVEQNAEFLQAVMPWLDSTEYIDRYAYFWDAAGSVYLVNSDGSTLSETGIVYNNYY